MRGLSLMIRRLIRMIQDGFLLSVSYIVLTMAVSLGVLEIFLGPSNLAWWVLGLSMLAIVIFLRTRQWPDGEKESHKKSVLQGLAVPLWVGADDSLESQCRHCGKPLIIQCRV